MTFVVAAFFQVLNPIPLSLIVALLLVWLFRRVATLRKYWKHILGVIAVLYCIDFLFAIPRIVYAYATPEEYQIYDKAELPKDLILVELGCDPRCVDLFASGAINTITRVTTQRQSSGLETQVVNRYRRAWKRGDCDPKNYNFASLNVSHTKIFEMRTKQFCPEVEDIEIPETGLFIISNAYGRHNGSSFLVDKPFGTVNGFAATEVQYRSSRNVKVLAKTRFLEMLGPIGPLVGYWETHGDFATFPRGAKGWGYWRPIMTGGSYNHLLNMEWIFDHVLLQRNADATEKARVPQN